MDTIREGIDILHIDFVEPEAKVTSKVYFEMLSKLKYDFYADIRSCFAPHSDTLFIRFKWY